MQTATEVWRTKPLYDIEKITLLKKRVVDGEEFVYAELAFAGKTVRYSISTPATKWRVQTLFTKEPGTLDWIHSFRPGDVYVDVGANVGMYSVYAGVVAGARVYAFEPEAQNFAALCRSIYLNGTGQTIVPYCAAICDTPMVFSHLLLNGMLAGLSYHDFAAPSRAYDERSRFAQGCIGCSLDHLIGTSAVPTPDHVKIDVDGHEDKVIDGMRGLLGERAIRTLLLECDPGLPRTAEIVKGLIASGWHVNPDQVRLTRSGLRPAEPVMAEVRDGAYVGNVIFGRSPDDVAFATDVVARLSNADLERMRLPE